MNAPNDNTVAEGLRRWWASPPRHGLVGGSVAAAASVTCLSYGVYGRAAFFLVIGAGNLAGGYWYLTIARSAPVDGA